MLFDSKLPTFLWAEAMHHTAWIKNQVPTSAMDNVTPCEGWTKIKPDFSQVIPFGTCAWVKIVDAGKLDPQVRLGYFIGFDDESHGYRIYLQG
jgi:hypothetical protein